MAVKKWSISFTPEIAQEIERRSVTSGERSMKVNSIIDRYFEILRQCRKDLRHLLSDQEMTKILESLHGVAFQDAHSVRILWASVQNGLDQAGKEDAGLVAKLKGLDYAHSIALIDAVEQAGNQPEYKEA